MLAIFRSGSHRLFLPKKDNAFRGEEEAKSLSYDPVKAGISEVPREKHLYA
jgi:hypothetical protein